MSKTTPLSTVTMQYNTSDLPKSIFTKVQDTSYEEVLEWDQSGKIAFHSANGQQQHFTYTSRGYLESTEKEKYEFDFGGKGIGTRTKASNIYVPENGLDAFGKIVTEISKASIMTTYDAMGQVVSQNQKQFIWDPWGRLIKVTDEAYTWEATYDALGRRLQTCYTPKGSSPILTTSFYDPEEEFQEIGIKYGDLDFVHFSI